jgi:hypothetical protein
MGRTGCPETSVTNYNLFTNSTAYAASVHMGFFGRRSDSGRGFSPSIYALSCQRHFIPSNARLSPSPYTIHAIYVTLALHVFKQNIFLIPKPRRQLLLLRAM